MGQCNQVEIMAPVGSWESLHAAINAGANSIYFGMEFLNMRSHAAHNFTLQELPQVVQICKDHAVKSYVTLNSLIYDEDLPLMKQLCQAIKASGADAIIASDISVLVYAKSINLNVHISTQLNVSNIEAVRFFSQFADVVVLARELTVEQIQKIHQAILEGQIRGPKGKLIQIELFVHGAMCIAVSGKCHMSLMEQNQSANRGKCTQVCRRKFRVIDEQTDSELILDNQYVMSPKDLCTVSFLNQLIEAGVSVLKIEGRGRAPEYVHTVVGVYKEACQAIAQGTFTQEKVVAWKEKLSTVYNRGFWEGGYYLGKKQGEWSGAPGSQATQTKTHVGKITNYFSKIQVAELLIESGSLKRGDKILITGPLTGVVEHCVESIHAQGVVEIAEKGMLVAIPVPGKVRKNDKLYLLETRSAKLEVLSS